MHGGGLGLPGRRMPDDINLGQVNPDNAVYARWRYHIYH